MKLDPEALDVTLQHVIKNMQENGEEVDLEMEAIVEENLVDFITVYLRALSASSYKTAVANLHDARQGLLTVMKICTEGQQALTPLNSELSRSCASYLKLIAVQADAAYHGNFT